MIPPAGGAAAPLPDLQTLRSALAGGLTVQAVVEQVIARRRAVAAGGIWISCCAHMMETHREGVYVRVTGMLRSFNNVRNVNVYNMHPVLDMNEVRCDALEARACCWIVAD